MNATIYYYNTEVDERVFDTTCEDESDIKRWFIDTLITQGVESEYELDDEVVDSVDSFAYGDEWICIITRDEYDDDDDHITQMEDMEEWREWLRTR